MVVLILLKPIAARVKHTCYKAATDPPFWRRTHWMQIRQLFTRRLLWLFMLNRLRNMRSDLLSWHIVVPDLNDLVIDNRPFTLSSDLPSSASVKTQTALSNFVSYALLLPHFILFVFSSIKFFSRTIQFLFS